MTVFNLKVLYIIFFCLNLFQHTSAQDYIPMLNENARWFYFSIPPGDGNYGYEIDGDTILNDKRYFKVNQFQCSLTDSSCGKVNYGLDYKVLLREDTLNRKVYMMEPFDSTEMLLYDFSLQPNDTFRFRHSSGVTKYDLVVDSIGSIETSEDHRKIFYLSQKPSTYAQWIEGIGSRADLLYNYLQYFEGNQFLSCFYVSDFRVFQHYDSNITNNCVQRFSNREDLYKKKPLYISPNPATDLLNVKFSGMGNYNIAVINSLGSLIYQAHNLNSSVDIYVSKYPSGIYYVRVNNAKGSWTGKVVIGE